MGSSNSKLPDNKVDIEDVYKARIDKLEMENKFLAREIEYLFYSLTTTAEKKMPLQFSVTQYRFCPQYLGFSSRETEFSWATT